MAADALAKLLDKDRIAQAKARFSAWWKGAPVEAIAAAAASSPQDDLFAPEAEALDPRIQALQWCWGPDRLAPTEPTGDGLTPVRLGISAAGALAILGPGLAGPVIAAAAAHPGALTLLEWRAETLKALSAGLARAELAARTEVAAFDLETGALAPEAYQGLWAIDAFAYCGNPSRLAVQIARSLTPGACAVIETYARGPNAGEGDLSACFASAFLEPQLLPAPILQQILFEAGLRVDGDEDILGEHLDAARASLADAGARMTAALPGPPSAQALQELAWEVESWAARFAAGQAGRLTRRRLTLTKR